jgi:hypothetical protein
VALPYDDSSTDDTSSIQQQCFRRKGSAASGLAATKNATKTAGDKDPVGNPFLRSFPQHFPQVITLNVSGMRFQVLIH